jgi:hypothetical protein
MLKLAIENAIKKSILNDLLGNLFDPIHGIK